MTTHRPETIFVGSILQADPLSIRCCIGKLSSCLCTVTTGVARFVSADAIARFVEPVIGTVSGIIIDVSKEENF